MRPARATGSAAPGSRRSTRTSSRTPAAPRRADALALMAEARRRAHEQFGVALRARGRVPRRARAARAVGRPDRAPKSGAMPARARPARSIARAETARAASATGLAAGASAAWLARSHRRAARSRSASACSRSRSAVTCSRARRRSSRSTGSRCGAAPRRSRSRSTQRSRRSSAEPLVGLDGSAVLDAGRRAPDGRQRDATTARSRTPCASPSYRSGPPPSCAAAPTAGSSRARGRVMERLASSAVPHLPRIWISHEHAGPDRQRSRRPALRPRGAHAAGLAGAFAARVASASYAGRDARLPPPLRPRAAARRAAATSSSSSPWPSRCCAMLAARLDVPRREHPGRPVAGTRSPTSSLHRKPLVEVEVEARSPVDTERSRTYPPARSCCSTPQSSSKGSGSSS